VSAALFPTPPTTPESTRKGAIEDATALQQFTPSAIGLWLNEQTMPQVFDADSATSYLSDVISLESIHQALHDFNEDAPKDVRDYAKRVYAVAKMIPVSPPSDPTGYAARRTAVLKLVFSYSAAYSPYLCCLSYRDISKISLEVSEKLKAYCTAYANVDRHEVAVNLGCRFLALQTFSDKDVAPPRNLSWTFLILCQLIWERLALKHKTIFGLDTVKDQNIQAMVNADLKQLCILAKKSPTRDVIKGIKVHYRFYWY
jgi:hypothetical protein